MDWLIVALGLQVGLQQFKILSRAPVRLMEDLIRQDPTLPLVITLRPGSNMNSYRN